MPKTFQMSQSFAVHEVGKALVATVMRQDRERQGLKPRLERVERVSMVPRGRWSFLLLCCAMEPQMYKPDKVECEPAGRFQTMVNALRLTLSLWHAHLSQVEAAMVWWQGLCRLGK